MSFSERAGFEKPREMIQINSMDERLRIALYNHLHDRFKLGWFTRGGMHGGPGEISSRKVWTDLLHQPIDKFESSLLFCIEFLKAIVLEGPWNHVYDLIEYLDADTPMDVKAEEVNNILEREMSGYRLINQMVVPVSDETELAAIDEAMTLEEPFSGARAHIVDALKKLGQKPDPDLRNAIKEAVSAVESAARVSTGMRKALLPDALKLLDKNGVVHPALKEAWLKLYGYTSDEGGLRHAMIEDPRIDFSTAKYMVVSCAAFVNLLSTLGPAT